MPKDYIQKHTYTIGFHKQAYRVLIKTAILQAIIAMLLIAFILYKYIFPAPENYYVTTILGNTVEIIPELQEP